MDYHPPMEALEAAERAWRCDGCGATLRTPSHLLSTRCSYCEAPLVEVAAADVHIDGVVPFTLSADAAAAKLSAFLKGHRWAPRELRRHARHSGLLRAVYVPHQVYEGVVRASYDAAIGITYTKRVGTGKNRKTVVRTDWHGLRGTYGRSFEDHLVSASAGLDEEHSNGLEPFDLGHAHPFDPRMVAGIEAELPTHERLASQAVLADELEDIVTREISTTFLPGDSQRLDAVDVDAQVSRSRVVLLPIWFGTFHLGGEARHCFINGQTGRVVGQVPVSRAKIAMLAAAALVVVLVVWLVMRGGTP